MCLPSLHPLPWGTHGFCIAKVCAADSKAPRCRDSAEQVCAGILCVQHSLYPASVSTALQGPLNFPWNPRKIFFILKNWAQNGKQKWSRALGIYLGRKEENVSAWIAKTDAEHHLTFAEVLCEPASSFTSLVLRDSIFLHNGHCSLLTQRKTKMLPSDSDLE